MEMDGNSQRVDGCKNERADGWTRQKDDVLPDLSRSVWIHSCIQEKLENFFVLLEILRTGVEEEQGQHGGALA